MKKRKQLVILLAGIILAALLLISNLRAKDQDSLLIPTKKPKQNTSALIHS